MDGIDSIQPAMMVALQSWLRENWRIALAVVAGAVVVLVVGLTTNSTPAVLVTGLVVGILVGGLISSMSREDRDGAGSKRDR